MLQTLQTGSENVKIQMYSKETACLSAVFH